MIYKFENSETIQLEIEYLPVENVLQVSMRNEDESPDEWISLHLSRYDVYKLIGALHLLHKEME